MAGLIYSTHCEMVVAMVVQCGLLSALEPAWACPEELDIPESM